MDRCIVEGCTTGLLKATPNTRQKILFKVPSDAEILNRWCIALGQILEPGDKVCDIHFKEDDILKNLTTFTKVQGQQALTFKKRVNLRQGAVPIPRDPLKIEECNSSEEKQSWHLPQDDEIIYDISDESVNDISHFNNGNDVEEIKSEKGDQDDLDEKFEQHIIRIPTEDDCPEANQESTKEKIVSNYVKNGVVIERVVQSTKSNNTNNETLKLCQKRKRNHIFSANNKLSRLGISPQEPSRCNKKIKKTVFQYSPTKPFESFDELKYFVLHRCIRQQWCAKIEQDSVFFSYVDFDKSRVNCCLEVSYNFKVNAYTADKIIAIYVATTDGVKNINEIVDIMKVLEKKRWCLGPGIPLVNRSPDCIGAMPLKSANESCHACIREKLDSLSHTRELANCRIKLEESRHKHELMRKKHYYVSTQYERLKAETKILEYQVDQAKKIAINDVLNRLPTLQQCVVRYLINSTYMAKCAVRYGCAWINECLVMRAMSPALYEYLRQKEILPLPSIDTLKKHKYKTAGRDSKASESDDSIDYSKLPESPEVPNPVEVIESADIIDFPEIAEAIDRAKSAEIVDAPIIFDSSEIVETSEVVECSEIIESSEIPEPVEIPESTNPEEYNIIEIAPECIVSEEVAYEVTIGSEPSEEQQY